MKALLAVSALVATTASGPALTPAGAAPPALTPAGAAPPAPTPLAVTPKPAQRPSAAQIRAAVRRAKRSSNLWGTINICNTKRYPKVIGIRGQMPALGFETILSMAIQVDYWNVNDKKFEPDPGVEKTVVLGPATSGLHQDGVSFRFVPPADLSGQISFTWKLAGKVIGRASRLTAGRLKHVAFGDPPGHSAATCRIKS